MIIFIRAHNVASVKKTSHIQIYDMYDAFFYCMTKVEKPVVFSRRPSVRF